MSKQDLCFRIELQRVDPLIWRRLQVPGAYTFWDLHVAIQDAMGWLDYHLHVFRVTNPLTGQMDEVGIPFEEDTFDALPCLAGWETPLSSYFTKPTAKAEYNYDFGDDWRVDITLESSKTLKKDLRGPVCVVGERAAPPEDCGGPYGYLHLLEVLADSAHPEHKEMKSWLGGKFDAEAFDTKNIHFDDPQERWRIAFERKD